MLPLNRKHPVKAAGHAAFTGLQLPTSERRCYFGSEANVGQSAEAAPDDRISRWRI
ncbi:hypothetical protein IB277_37700 [Ensifer sp. ENS07]|nr:hypothetical protein [Ensifer sp. ENS07]